MRTLDVHNLDVDFKGFSKQSELIEEMGQLIMERVHVRMTNDASSNSFMLHQMSTTELFQSAIDGLHDITMSEQSEQFIGSDSSQVLSMPNFVATRNTVCDTYISKSFCILILMTHQQTSPKFPMIKV